MSEERGAERVDGADDLSVDDNAPLQLPLQLPLGTSEHTVEHGGLNRSFTVYRPSFDQLTAVVLCLHELHSNATNACRDYCAPYAAELGFVAVCPQGTPPGVERQHPPALSRESWPHPTSKTPPS